MGERVSEDMKLLIISDTAMWKAEDGIYVFEPTLREIESLGEVFEKVVWMGFNYGDIPKASARKSCSSHLHFTLFPKAIGGENIFKKLSILPFLPMMTIRIWLQMRKFDFIHTRSPSVPSFIAILLSYLLQSKKYWHKYAGTWNGNDGPWTYRIQKKLLTSTNFAKVTVNGSWPGLKPHILPFINPCLTLREIEEAEASAETKLFTPPYTFCFVGRLEEQKGLGNLLTALTIYEGKLNISKLIVAGDGNKRDYEDMVGATGIFVEFTGPLNRNQLNKVYSQSHFIILPSLTEGFPKVISEAMAFGCIPLVTNVSAINEQVIDEVNGFLLENNQPETITARLEAIGKTNDLKQISKNAITTGKRFDYDLFARRISDEIFELNH